VRKELFAPLASRAAARTRRLVQLLVFDEVESLGRRTGGDDPHSAGSTAANDVVQALLSELDGVVQREDDPGRPPAQLLVVGLTNRPDLLDEALKRPGRFGDLVLEMPALTRAAAEQILALYARAESVPWLLDGEARTGVEADVVRTRVLEPALAQVFDAVVLRYSTDGRANVAVTAGEAMSSVHFVQALESAKSRAARRELEGVGVAAVRVEDVVDALVDQALAAARQMDADRAMLARQLRVQGRILRVEHVAEDALRLSRFVRNSA
jgi:SpoVK/Ycf46/Vps4 family AAA+-type ATPase